LVSFFLLLFFSICVCHLLFLQMKISSHYVMLCPLHGDRVVTLWRHRCPVYSPATISSHTVIRSMPCHAEEARYYIKTHAPLPLHPASSTVRPTTLPDIWPPQPWTYAFPEQAIGRCVNWSNVTWSHGQHELSRHTLMMMIKKQQMTNTNVEKKKKKKKKTPKTQSMTPRTVKLADIRRFTVDDNRWFCQVCK